MTPTPTPRMIRFAKVSTALLLVGGVSLAMRVESQSSKKVGAKKDAGKSVSQKGAQKTSPAQTASQNVAKPAGYVISIPNTVVKISMLPIPAGETNIGGQAVKVKPTLLLVQAKAISCLIWGGDIGAILLLTLALLTAKCSADGCPR